MSGAHVEPLRLPRGQIAHDDGGRDLAILGEVSKKLLVAGLLLVQSANEDLAGAVDRCFPSLHCRRHRAQARPVRQRRFSRRPKRHARRPLRVLHIHLNFLKMDGEQRESLNIAQLTLYSRHIGATQEGIMMADTIDFIIFQKPDRVLELDDTRSVRKHPVVSGERGYSHCHRGKGIIDSSDGDND